jgi:hypothetical protein
MDGLARQAVKGEAREVSNGPIRRVPDGERDEELLEAWELDEGLFSISAGRCDRRRLPWQVSVGAIDEFVRDESLLTDIDVAMVRALSDVAGVTEVAGEDYGVWAVQGTAAGPALVGAAREALEPFRTEVARECRGSRKFPRVDHRISPVDRGRVGLV